MEYHPCLVTKRLPSIQRETYLSWEDFQKVLEDSWWLHDILVLLYCTGMRFGEADGVAMGDVQTRTTHVDPSSRGDEGREESEEVNAQTQEDTTASRGRVSSGVLAKAKGREGGPRHSYHIQVHGSI